MWEYVTHQALAQEASSLANYHHAAQLYSAFNGRQM
jgi:hypothetical protein